MNKLKDYFNAAPKWSRVLFWVLLWVSIMLVVASFIIPPLGVIDPSVLAAIGEIMGFASIGMAFECVFCGFDVKMQKGDTTIEINSDDKTDE